MTAADSYSSTPSTPFHPDHLRYFVDRAVDPAIAAEAGYSSLSVHDWESLKSAHAGLPHPGGLRGPSGLHIIYPEAGGYFRIRPDFRYYYADDSPDGSGGTRVDFEERWFAPPGRDVPPFIPPRVRTALHAEEEANRLNGTHLKSPVFIVEAPTKALALWCAGQVAVGLGGVEAGGHAKGEPKPTLHEDLGRLDWRGREGRILFDANIWTKAGVARGAARVAWALSRAAAVPVLVRLPLRNTHDMSVEEIAADPMGDGMGPDDFLAQHPTEARPEALARLVADAVPALPQERLRLVVDGAGSPDERRGRVLALLEELYFQATLKLGGRANLDAAAAILKRVGLTKGALNEAVNSFNAKERQKLEESDDGNRYVLVNSHFETASGEALSNFAAVIESETVYHDANGATERIWEIRGTHECGRDLGVARVSPDGFHKCEPWWGAYGPQARLVAGKSVKDCFREAVQVHSVDVRADVVYRHTGWVQQTEGGWMYLHGAGAVGGENVRVELPEKYARFQFPTRLLTDNERGEVVGSGSPPERYAGRSVSGRFCGGCTAGPGAPMS